MTGPLSLRLSSVVMQLAGLGIGLVPLTTLFFSPNMLLVLPAIGLPIAVLTIGIGWRPFLWFVTAWLVAITIGSLLLVFLGISVFEIGSTLTGLVSALCLAAATLSVVAATKARQNQLGSRTQGGDAEAPVEFAAAYMCGFVSIAAVLNLAPETWTDGLSFDGVLAEFQGLIGAVPSALAILGATVPAVAASVFVRRAAAWSPVADAMVHAGIWGGWWLIVGTVALDPLVGGGPLPLPVLVPFNAIAGAAWSIYFKREEPRNEEARAQPV